MTDRRDTKTILAFIWGIVAGLLIATMAVLPPWLSRDAIDAGDPLPENPTASAGSAPENPTAPAGSPAVSAPGSRAFPPSPPLGPATQLARQRESLSSFQAPMHPGLRGESLTVTGVLSDVWRWDGRIFVQVYEDPEDKGVLVVAAFDPQTWDEPLGELARGTRVRLHGVNAVAGLVAVEMDGTEFEGLAEAAPAGSAPESHASPPSPPLGPATQLARQRDSLTSFQRAVSAICRLIGRLMDPWGRLTSVWGSKWRPAAVVAAQSLIAKLPEQASSANRLLPRADKERTNAICAVLSIYRSQTRVVLEDCIVSVGQTRFHRASRWFSPLWEYR